MTPWMHESEIALIEKYLSPEKIMLEWGCGGSTVYFSKQVKEYYSIEHDREWLDKIKEPDNVCLFHVPRNKPVSECSDCYEAYRDYVDFPARLGTKFDVVLIDGRARVPCAKHVIPLLNPGAVVFVHDFWKPTRERYRVILDWYEEIESIKDTEQTIIALGTDQR